MAIVVAPSHTVSLLFTDIEGSTRLWEADPAAMSETLAAHDRIVRDAVSTCGGSVFASGGDGFAAAFPLASDALNAALRAQLDLREEPLALPITVRMAVHTGAVEERSGDYFGPPLNRCARLMAAAHGGQMLCSAATASLARGQLPDGSRLVDLGEHRLRDLAEPEHVFQLVHESLRVAFPPLRSLDSYPGNLPLQATTFVGREAELTELGKALEETRVLTLSGVGGVGKTRLGLQVAAEIVPRFRDGAWLVELAAVGDPNSFEEAVALALGVRQRPGMTMREAVLEFLRDKSLLLVLDNCEHLLGAVASFVELAISTAADLRVLATSREGLAVAGERITTVPSLELPAATSSSASVRSAEAVRLFIDRASEADSGFSAGPDDMQSIAELCRRLDGIPLAIELAAARVRGMTPAEITAHLDRRFRLLTRGRRTAAPRHQTLRNTIDWSYDLLDEPERTVLRRLGVFQGSFALDAAEAIASGGDVDSFEVVDLLVRLVDKSLVVAENRSGSSRYRLLETVRDYAWERLQAADELDEVAQRHAREYVAFAKRAGAGLEGPDELLWRSRVEEDLENLRGALRWAIDSGDVGLALSEVEALNTVGSLRTPPFGLMALEAARMAGADQHELHPMALASVCMTLTQNGTVDQAIEFADAAEESARRLWGDGAAYASLRCRLGGCITTAIAYSGDFDRLVRLARASLDHARRSDDRFEITRALVLLTGVLPLELHEEAVLCGEEALLLAARIGTPSYLAWAPMMLAGRLGASDPERAAALFDQAVTAAAAADNDWARSQALAQLAAAQARQAQYEAASRSLMEMTTMALAQGDHGTAQTGVGWLACLLAVRGEDESALLAGAWAEQRGFRFPETSEHAQVYAAYNVSAYRALRARHIDAELHRMSQRALAISEIEMIDFLRVQLESVDAEHADHNP